MKIFRSWIWPIIAVILIVIAISMKLNDEAYPTQEPAADPTGQTD